MVDVYGVPCDVHSVRGFNDGRQLGAGYDLEKPETWFVYDREQGRDGNGVWHKHCGPMSSFEQAKEWILAIRESKPNRLVQTSRESAVHDKKERA